MVVRVIHRLIACLDAAVVLLHNRDQAGGRVLNKGNGLTFPPEPVYTLGSL